MKTFRLIFVFMCIGSMTFILQACSSPMEVKSVSPGAFVGGAYEWDSTVTPTRKLSPASVGYSQQFQNTLPGINVPSPGISFYRNDSLVQRGYLVSTDSAFIGDNSTSSALVRFRSPVGYLRYQILDNYQVTLSNFLSTYTIEADTVKHYYHPAQRVLNYYP